ncbi:Bub1, partial [Operophtera brumata]
MLHDDSPTKRKAASALAETRMALTSLKSFKRRNIANVPVQRVGDSIRSTMPGVDAPSTSHAGIPVAEDPGPASLVQACSNVENEKEIGIWTNPKTKMVHTNVVYVGETEYSLEEIRSRKYNLERKAKPENQENIVQQHYTSINETLAQCSALETLANCALDPEQDHLGQLMPLAIPTLQNITKVSNMHSPGEPKVLCNLDSKEFSELSSKKSDENQTSHVDKENLVHQLTPVNYGNENNPENYGKNNLMEEFNRSLMGNLLGDSVTRKQELANMANVGQDKENANKFNPVASQPQQNVNKTAYYEEPSCTQVFNFNIKDASTPNMSQFKKPSSNIDQSKYSSVPKFSIDESGIEHVDPALGKREENSRQQGADQHATDNQGGGLSVIMEATREFN